MKEKSGCLFQLIILISTTVYAQDVKTDLCSISRKEFSCETIRYYPHPEHNNSNPIMFHSNNFLVKINPFNLFFKGLMTIYQKGISPQISAACLYETTCSNFSKEAIHEFGLFKGVFLTADRLLRCNRSSAREIPFMDIDIISGKALDPPSKYRIRIE
jgi:putative membrane protein insertion efficiency factor